MLFILNGNGVPSIAKIVQVATLSSIAVTPVNPSIQTGATQQFTATGTYSDGRQARRRYYEPGDLGVVEHSEGHYQWKWAGHGRVRWQHYHIRDIARGDWVTGSTTLTVQAPTLNSIAVTPVNPSIQTGATQQFTATGTYSDGSTQNLTTFVTWTTSNSMVADSPPKWAGHGQVRWHGYHIRDILREDWEHYANGAGANIELDSGDAG